MTLPLHQFADQLAEHLSDVFSRTSFLKTIERVCRRATATDVARIVTVSLHFDSLDPLAVLERLTENDKLRYYWEKPELDLAMSASGSVAEIKGSGINRFQDISAAIKATDELHDGYAALTHSLTGLHFVGGFSFFDNETNGDWANFGTARFVVPEWLFVRDGSLGLLTIARIVEPGCDETDLIDALRSQFQALNEKLAVYRIPGSDNTESESQLEFTLSEGTETKEHWSSIVNAATLNIQNGAYDKIVLARTVRAETSRTIADTRLLHHLRSEYPSCYSFLLQFPDTASFVGCTPERLVSVQSGFLTTEGLAGSIPRGLSATDDSILEKRLLMSDKDQEEHRFVVESIMSRLREFTSEIQSSSRPGIRKFANVQHLYTPISARLPLGTDPIAVIERLHPTPAVGGAPRQSALDGIPELEGFRRGWYAGPIGWINANGRGEFSVAIRSGLINKNHAIFYAGCGIVDGSDPDSEWAETELKLIPMLTALRHA